MTSVGSCHIVLTDDDQDDRYFLKSALQKHSFKCNVIETEHGVGLMDYLNDSHTSPLPELIVLDLNMPYKNGYQVLNDLKNDSALRPIPCVVLTASSKKEDELRCYQLGCTKFYTKPISLIGYDVIAQDIIRLLEPKGQNSDKLFS
jgi:CheY-like chemotaxis protein